MLNEHTSPHRANHGFIRSLPSQARFLKFMSYGRLVLSLLLLLLLIHGLVRDNPWHLPILAILQIALSMAVVSVLLFYAYQRHYSLEQLMRFSLMLDVFFLSELIYFTGGAANPITVLYFLPIINASLFCSPRFARGLTIAAILCYLLLFFHYWPLSIFEHTMTMHGAHDEQGDSSMLFHLIETFA